MSEDNIVDLFGNVETDDPKKIEHNYKYTVTTKSGSEYSATGYIVIGHSFYAVARGEGILYDIWPLEEIAYVKNHGPINAAALN